MGKVFIKVQQQYFKPEDKQMYFTKNRIKKTHIYFFNSK